MTSVLLSYWREYMFFNMFSVFGNGLGIYIYMFIFSKRGPERSPDKNLKNKTKKMSKKGYWKKCPTKIQKSFAPTTKSNKLK